MKLASGSILTAIVLAGAAMPLRAQEDVKGSSASASYAGRYYFLHIVEREPMPQIITADAMAAAIEKIDLSS